MIKFSIKLFKQVSSLIKYFQRTNACLLSRTSCLVDKKQIGYVDKLAKLLEVKKVIFKILLIIYKTKIRLQRLRAGGCRRGWGVADRVVG